MKDPSLLEDTEPGHVELPVTFLKIDLAMIVVLLAILGGVSVTFLLAWLVYL